MGPQPVVSFTTDHMVVWNTLTMDRLLSVYQGDTNVHHLSGTVCGEKRGSQRGTVRRYAA